MEHHPRKCLQFVLGNFEAVVIDNSVAAVTLENEALLFAFFIVFATVMTSVFTIYWVGQIFVWQLPDLPDLFL